MKLTFLLYVSIVRCNEFERQENEEDKQVVLNTLERLIRKRGHKYIACLTKIEFSLIGCLKEHETGHPWTKCRNEFGHAMEDMRRYSGEANFKCPITAQEKQRSFYDNYGKQIFGAAGVLLAVPGQRRTIHINY